MLLQVQASKRLMADQWGFVKHELETTVALSAAPRNGLQLDSVVQLDLDSNLTNARIQRISLASAILPARNAVPDMDRFSIQPALHVMNLTWIELDWNTYILEPEPCPKKLFPPPSQSTISLLPSSTTSDSFQTSVVVLSVSTSGYCFRTMLA